MIEIKYKNNSIRVETKKLNDLFCSEQLPLVCNFIKQVNSRILWGTQLGSDSWATFPDSEMVDVKITDNLGNLIHTHKWNCFENGTFLYQKLFNFCLLNKSKNIQNNEKYYDEDDNGMWIRKKYVNNIV